MMYPYLTLNDDTEITHSEMNADGRVKVYIETPDEQGGFRNATCYLPDYTWENISGYSAVEIEYFKRLIRDNAHLILEFSQEGGILNEGNPLEPIHVHVAEGRASANGTKIWITSTGKTLLSNNNTKIPSKILRGITRIIEANSAEIIEKWIEQFGEITYFC